MTIALPQSSYRTEEQVFSFYQQLMERLERLPGVLGVGAGTDLPLQSTWTRLFTAEGWKEPPSGISPTNAHTVVFGNYLSALGIPLKRGRFFTDQDRVGTSGVLLINETMSRRFWPNEDPLGKRLKWGLPQAENPWLTIVGVVGDVKDGRLNAETRPHTYEPYLQNRQMRSLRVVLRGARGPENLAAAMRAQVLALDRDLPVSDLQTMEQVIVDSVAPQRFNTILLGSFAAVALILASVGIYGVMSYLVTQRTPEIGVRLALGAQQKDVFRLVVRQGMGLVLIGLVMGLVGALGATRLLSNLLYGIGATDPATYTAVSLLLIGVALLASVIPAYRASKVNPIVALRYE
jgi:putative ABC transport system permease protein